MAWLIVILSCIGSFPAQSSQPDAREARLRVLRARAQDRLDADRLVYSTTELQDIEARYRSAHQELVPESLKPGAALLLADLVDKYPRSTRAGCAVVELAQTSNGDVRRHYLALAIDRHSDAWCGNGVQVGALARALLAVSYADAGRFDEAERIAREMMQLFPDAVDSAGAPLDTVLEGIKLLRPRR